MNLMVSEDVVRERAAVENHDPEGDVVLCKGCSVYMCVCKCVFNWRYTLLTFSVSDHLIRWVCACV